MRSNATWDETAGALLGIAATIAFVMLLRKAWRQRDALKRELDRPFKRLAAVVLMFSTPMLVVGVIQISFTTNGLSEFISDFSEAVFFPNEWNDRGYWPARYGFFGVSIGLAFSFLYDANIGRLLSWIRHG